MIREKRVVAEFTSKAPTYENPADAALARHMGLHTADDVKTTYWFLGKHVFNPYKSTLKQVYNVGDCIYLREHELCIEAWKNQLIND